MGKILVIAAILIFPVTSFSAVRIWTGGGANQNWTTPANWQDNTAPVAGDDLVFPASAAQPSNNNNFLLLTSFRSITFQGGTYTIGGNPLRLTHGISIEGGAQTLNTSITLSAAQTISAAQGSTLTLLALSVGSNTLTIGGNGTVGIGLISGSGQVIKDGLGIAGIFAATGFSGPIKHNDGIFVVDANIGSSPVTINSSVQTGNPSFAGFGGTGTIGPTDVTSGVISSGTLTSLTGILNINGGITFQPEGFYVCKIEGTTAGAGGHDQLNVTGTVALNNARLVPLPLGTFRPVIGTSFVILRNDSNDPISGTFLGLPEGASFAGAGNTAFRITYAGGDGNDIVISVIPKAPLDFDGDNRSDVGIYRPQDGTWWLDQSSLGVSAVSWGLAEDKLVPADYDGDGRTDIAVFRPSTSQWYVINSLTSTVSVAGFGATGDIPAPGDFDGDGRADISIFRPSDGTWWMNQSTAGIRVTSWGGNGDLPVVGDYDGDGISDVAIYRPSSGTWWLSRSQAGIAVLSWGVSTDKVVPADYDGDGKTDIAVYRPSSGLWYLFESTTQAPRVISFGGVGDIPAAADFDGDGKCDVAIFRPSTGSWWLNRTSGGVLVVPFGLNGDIPVQSAYVY